MFDRYEAGEQAVLVHIYFSQDKDTEDLSEFESLVSSAGVEALQVVTGSRKARIRSTLSAKERPKKLQMR